MSVILGLNSNHADSSACLIKNGKLLFAVEEERINRIKHWAGLPIDSIRETLKSTNINVNEITDISINTNPLSNINHKMLYFLKNYLFGKKKYEIISRLRKKINLKKEINYHLKKGKFSDNIKIHYIDHHLSHIASAYYPSNFDDAVGLSIDGFGDFASICIAKCNKNGVKILKKYLFPHSLGVFYESFTQLIGFKNYGDEYKMMGLSSFGKPAYYELILNKVFTKKNNYQLNLDYFNHTNNNFSYKFEGQPNQNDLYNEKLEKLLNIKNLKVDQISDIHKNIAASAQKVFEKKLLEICNEIKEMKISENLVYAGGCALNSLANKKLFDSMLFKNIFIPYAPGDGGGSIGSALIVAKNKDRNVNFSNLKSPYIGPKFSNTKINDEILKMNELSKFKIEHINDKNILYDKVAKLIFENKIIGFFNNQMEFGARALGNRSILANPCDTKIQDIINSKIKRREMFRPFAPAILNEKKSEWFDNSYPNPYMSAVEKINESKRHLIPAVTHIDGTGRVQTVSKEINNDFHLLITKFYQISNVPILLNTSFNENEPIVMDPKHAIECFLRTKMDILILNKYIIQR
jgi:carbamoyltransferase